jgi:chromosome segregation ATPase
MPNGTADPRLENPPTPGTQLRLDEVRRHLTENEAQRREVTGYINQLSIQLHRWQLRLQKLDERKAELEADLSASRA